MHDIQTHADRIRVAGYTTIPGFLPQPLVDDMRAGFDRLLAEHQASNPTNRGANRYQMYLPFEPPFSNPSLYENELALAICEAVLGPDPICSYFASDTPLPGSEHQRVHSDTRLLFPEAKHSLPCYGLVLNVPLVDVTEEMGPLEIWPGGSHLWPGGGDIPTLAESLPSTRILMNAGDAIIRDLRMWHRGTPNRGSRSRPNLALVYTRPWYRFEQKPPAIPRATYETLSDRAQKLFRFSPIAEVTGPIMAER